MTARNILKELESTIGTQKNLLATQSIIDKFALLNDRSQTLLSARRLQKTPATLENKDLSEHDQQAQLEARSPISGLTPNIELKITKVKKNIQNNSYIDSRVIAQAQQQLRREKLMEKMKDKNAKIQELNPEGQNKQNASMSQVLTMNDKRYTPSTISLFIIYKIHKY